MEKNRKKAGFNIIDVLLIAVFAALVVYLVYHVRGFEIVGKNSGKTAKTVAVGLEFSPLRDELHNCISVGDAVYDAATGKQIGEITNVSYTDCVYTGVNKTTGENVKSTLPGYVTLTATFSASATYKDGSAILNGTDIVADGILHIRTAGFEGNGRIIRIEEENQNAG
ncbi:MAG: DUF4330 domain-containing protein [Clostridia bacterium]|nr:DUF4330 domain-containing protein [Clostridia bacterium]